MWKHLGKPTSRTSCSIRTRNHINSGRSIYNRNSIRMGTRRMEKKKTYLLAKLWKQTTAPTWIYCPTTSPRSSNIYTWVSVKHMGKQKHTTSSYRTLWICNSECWTRLGGSTSNLHKPSASRTAATSSKFHSTSSSQYAMAIQQATAFCSSSISHRKTWITTMPTTSCWTFLRNYVHSSCSNNLSRYHPYNPHNLCKNALLHRTQQ
jgi:hypothetical protein